MSALLLDIGNSRLKWALGEGGVCGPVTALAHDGDPAAAFERLPLPAAVDAVCVCDVTNGALRRRLAEAIESRCGLAPHFAVSESRRDGLVNAYAEPQRLGVDRWLTMLAAWRMKPEALCVVGAGTALTVDLVDGHGRHLGGVIAPGLGLMRHALLGATRFPVGEQAEFTASALGCDTESAVQLGVMHAALGVVERCLRGHAVTAHYLTGGDAEVLAGRLGPEWTLAPDLIMQGLLALA